MVSKATLGALMFVGIIVAAAIVIAPMINQQPANITAPANAGVQQSQPASNAAPVSTPVSWANTASPLQMVSSDRDALAQSALTEATNLANTAYWSADGTAFNFLAAGVTGTTGVPMTVPLAAHGVIYIASQPVSAQNYYIAPQLTQNQNACVRGFDFMDPTGQNQPRQWIFKCDLSFSGLTPSVQNAGGSGGSSPQLNFYTNAYAYAAPTVSSNTGTTNNIGTSVDKNNQILFYINGTNQKAAAINEIDLTMNNTQASGNLWNAGVSTILLPIQSLTGAISSNAVSFSSATSSYTDGTNTYYKFLYNQPVSTTFGANNGTPYNNLKGANFLVVQTNGAIQIPVTVNFASDFAATTGVSVKMTIFYLTPSQGISTATKTVKMCAPAAPAAGSCV